MTTPTPAGAIWPARLAYTAAGLFSAASGITNLLYGIAKGSDDRRSPDHESHASRGVHKYGGSRLGYDAWEH